MSWISIVVLIIAGIFVGFINTLSGGGSVISLSLLILLGLPANIANGTNRISIFFQTFSSVGSFTKQKMFTDLKRELGRLVVDTTTKVTGKILTPEDQKRIAEESVREVSA